MHKMFTSLLLSGLLCLAGHAGAQDPMSGDDGAMEPSDAEADAPLSSTQFTCGYGELVRHVEVAYHEPGQPVPCSVLYNKETENPGDIETLWTAQNAAGYCEDKAANFVDKLEELGWICKGSASR